MLPTPETLNKEIDEQQAAAAVQLNASMALMRGGVGVQDTPLTSAQLAIAQALLAISTSICFAAERIARALEGAANK